MDPRTTYNEVIALHQMGEEDLAEAVIIEYGLSRYEEGRRIEGWKGQSVCNANSEPQGSTKLLDCHNCGGLGWVEGTDMAHHPACDGSCRNCPIEVQTQEPCPTCGGSGQVQSNVKNEGLDAPERNS